MRYYSIIIYNFTFSGNLSHLPFMFSGTPLGGPIGSHHFPFFPAPSVSTAQPHPTSSFTLSPLKSLNFSTEHFELNLTKPRHPFEPIPLLNKVGRDAGKSSCHFSEEKQMSVDIIESNQESSNDSA